jgi:asparagine synthase (glutamine-hydrolysing)
MRYFACARCSDGGRAREVLRARVVARPGPLLDDHVVRPARQRLDAGRFVAEAANGTATSWTAGGPRVGTVGRIVGTGDVRLDNRAEVIALALGHQPAAVVRAWRETDPALADLDIVLGALHACGPSCIPRLLGDFAFVAFDTGTGDLIAARDAFGVGALYYATHGGEMAFSSRASFLTHGDYRAEFLASYVAGTSDISEESIFEGVTTLPSGAYLVVRGGTAVVSQYWSPDVFEPRVARSPQDAAAQFRSLFVESVRARTPSLPDVAWAQLSGGLDSSSIVCSAHAASGLTTASGLCANVGGTITIVDTLGSGDERPFVDAVVEQTGVRNEQIIDPVMWEDDGLPPPIPDVPALGCLFHSVERAVCRTVRDAGGSVLLSGVGADHYLTGNLFFFADRLASGHPVGAVRELAHWAALGRISFWPLLYENALYPLLPRTINAKLPPAATSAPHWVTPAFARRFRASRASSIVRSLDAPVGRKYAGAIAHQLSHFGNSCDRGLVTDILQMRYPFLHRPLVEFALGLPPELRTRPFARKWILREAMRGILPEMVRSRRGKGSNGRRVLLSLLHPGSPVDDLLREPLLADLGCVEPARLRDAVESARHGRAGIDAALLTALSLETWLRVRDGRWAHGNRHARSPGAGGRRASGDAQRHA